MDTRKRPLFHAGAFGDSNKPRTTANTTATVKRTGSYWDEWNEKLVEAVRRADSDYLLKLYQFCLNIKPSLGHLPPNLSPPSPSTPTRSASFDSDCATDSSIGSFGLRHKQTRRRKRPVNASSSATSTVLTTTPVKPSSAVSEPANPMHQWRYIVVRVVCVYGEALKIQASQNLKHCEWEMAATRLVEAFKVVRECRLRTDNWSALLLAADADEGEGAYADDDDHWLPDNHSSRSIRELLGSLALLGDHLQEKRDHALSVMNARIEQILEQQNAMAAAREEAKMKMGDSWYCNANPKGGLAAARKEQRMQMEQELTALGDAVYRMTILSLGV